MLIIRSARIDDAATLCAAEQAIAETPGRLISRPEELRLEAFVSLIEKLSGGAGCYLVAEDNGACVGHALLNPMELIALAHVYRLTIVVHSEHSGKGIGTALMRSICEWAARSPAKCIKSSCWFAQQTNARYHSTESLVSLKRAACATTFGYRMARISTKSRWDGFQCEPMPNIA